MNQPIRKVQNSNFETGQLYSLSEIAGITTRFKSKTFLRNNRGMFHLYQNQVDKGYWIGGPFQGENSNLFLFLGLAKSEKEMKKLLQNLRSSQKKDQKSTETYENDFFPVIGSDFGFDLGLSVFLDHLAFDFDDIFDF